MRKVLPNGYANPIPMFGKENKPMRKLYFYRFRLAVVQKN